MKALDSQARVKLKQCPHCGQFISPGDTDNTMDEGFSLCPGCKLKYEEDRFA